MAQSRASVGRKSNSAKHAAPKRINAADKAAITDAVQTLLHFVKGHADSQEQASAQLAPLLPRLFSDDQVNERAQKQLATDVVEAIWRSTMQDPFAVFSSDIAVNTLVELFSVWEIARLREVNRQWRKYGDSALTRGMRLCTVSSCRVDMRACVTSPPHITLQPPHHHLVLSSAIPISRRTPQSPLCLLC